MTNYVGEEYRIATTATGYRGEPITEADNPVLTITILNKDKTVLVDEATMTWAEEDSKWEYMWDTEGLVSGSYRYRVTITGDDDKKNFEWRRARLSKVPEITA